jgi:hypothetical protein
MTVAHRSTAPRLAALAFLEARGAETIAHLNGTLLGHLLATEELLSSWGASEALCLAGLCHATYGTDGFAPSLLPWDDRAGLARLVGPEVEEIVYLYASCDRSVVYPQLATVGPVTFFDRFRQQSRLAGETEIRDFVDLTLANELDVALSAGRASGTATPRPSWIGPFVEQLEARASPAARAAARRLLASAPPASIRPSTPAAASPVPATGSAGRPGGDRAPGC